MEEISGYDVGDTGYDCWSLLKNVEKYIMNTKI